MRALARAAPGHMRVLRRGADVDVDVVVDILVDVAVDIFMLTSLMLIVLGVQGVWGVRGGGRCGGMLAPLGIGFVLWELLMQPSLGVGGFQPLGDDILLLLCLVICAHYRFMLSPSRQLSRRPSQLMACSMDVVARARWGRRASMDSRSRALAGAERGLSGGWAGAEEGLRTRSRGPPSLPPPPALRRHSPPLHCLVPPSSAPTTRAPALHSWSL